MAKCLMPLISGGGSNIEVIRVSSYSEIPASSIDGKIYIITEYSIPSNPNGIIWWAGALPTTRANGEALQNNDIAIMGGMSPATPIEVLTGYFMFPHAIYQRVSGSWVQKISWIRYQGNLVQMGYFLYKNGVVPGIGSWSFYDSAGEGSGEYLGKMVATCIPTSPYGACVKGPYDVSDWRIIRCLHRLYSSSYTVAGRLLICTNISSVAAMHSSTVAYADLPSSVSAWVETLLDVTNALGNCYVVIMANYYIKTVNKGSQVAQVIVE